MTMNELTKDIERLFIRINSIIQGDDDFYECEHDIDFEGQTIQILQLVHNLSEFLTRSENEQIPSIFKTSLEWLENEFKPKLEKIVGEKSRLPNPPQHFWDDFLEKYYDLTDFIIKESEKKDKSLENWIINKGFVETKCTRCGDGWSFFTLKDKVVCEECLKEEYEKLNFPDKISNK